MNEITEFVAKHLIGVLESTLIAHEPELQEDFLAGVRMLAEKTQDWVNGKLINAKHTNT
jgi:hypothetical protein